MVSILYDRRSSEGSLQFRFYHMLTGLRFVINNYSDEDDLQIHSLKLSGSFFRYINLDFTASTVNYTFHDTVNPDNDYYNGTYVIYDNPENPVRLDAAPTGEFTSSEGKFGQEYILLISGEDSYFGENVHVTIDYTFGTQERKSKEITRPGTFVPTPGVLYTAYLNFVGDAFSLQFEVGQDLNNGEINHQWDENGHDFENGVQFD